MLGYIYIFNHAVLYDGTNWDHTYEPMVCLNYDYGAGAVLAFKQ